MNLRAKGPPIAWNPLVRTAFSASQYLEPYPMSAFAVKSTIRIEEPDPFGEVTLAPAAVTGRSESELARSMADALLSAAPSTGTEALNILRRLFPHSPLTVRVAALDAVMRR
jgi:hypothetical protein